MFGNLTDCTEEELFLFVSLILSKPDKQISAFDHTELEQINDEFIRRKGIDYAIR